MGLGPLNFQRKLEKYYIIDEKHEDEREPLSHFSKVKVSLRETRLPEVNIWEKSWYFPQHIKVIVSIKISSWEWFQLTCVTSSKIRKEIEQGKVADCVHPELRVHCKITIKWIELKNQCPMKTVRKTPEVEHGKVFQSLGSYWEVSKESFEKPLQDLWHSWRSFKNLWLFGTLEKSYENGWNQDTEHDGSVVGFSYLFETSLDEQRALHLQRLYGCTCDADLMLVLMRLGALPVVTGPDTWLGRPGPAKKTRNKT